MRIADGATRRRRRCSLLYSTEKQASALGNIGAGGCHRSADNDLFWECAVKDEEPVKDVVCGMLVDPASFGAEYQSDHFAFCSAQCRERFLANPQGGSIEGRLFRCNSSCGPLAGICARLLLVNLPCQGLRLRSPLQSFASSK